MANSALSLIDVDAFYGDSHVLEKVSLTCGEGCLLGLLGRNGAGKSTCMNVTVGLLPARRGKVTVFGEDVTKLAPEAISARGVALVPQGRRIFKSLTVRENLTTEENLVAGGHVQKDGSAVKQGIELVYSYFPRLKERRHQQSGYLSGGEQQMLAIGRALMSQPRVVLLDEPSLGLAPMLVEEIFGIVGRLVKQEKLSVLLVEQNAAMALAVADHGYVMENGRIVLEGPADKLRDNSDIKEFYLGLNEGGARKSYRDTKHYKRRKRWLS